jgi:hypothetical protein
VTLEPVIVTLPLCLTALRANSISVGDPAEQAPRMKMLLRRLLLSLSFILLLPASLAFPLCTDASQSVTLPTSDRRWRAACSTNLLLLLLFLPPGAPVLLNTTLKFCASPSGNSSCCDATADAALSKQFDAMAIADAACAAVVKSILCAVSIIHPYHVPSLGLCKLCSFIIFLYIKPLLTCSTICLPGFDALGVVSRAGFQFRWIC